MVRVPATTANMGPGFDCAGMVGALSGAQKMFVVNVLFIL